MEKSIVSLCPYPSDQIELRVGWFYGYRLGFSGLSYHPVADAATPRLTEAHRNGYSQGCRDRGE